MLPVLAQCLPEALAWYRDKLALPGAHAGTIPGTDLLDGAVTERLMTRFSKSHPGGDRRALVSMWTQWHFGMLIIPATAAIVVLDRDLPVGLDRIGVAPHEEGRTAALVLADEGEKRAPRAARFSRLFDGHVAPLIAHFASHFEVSPRLLWSNATAIFEWTLQEFAAAGTAQPEALGEGFALLQSQSGPDGRRNPMFGAVRYPLCDGEPTRQRKVCCLRYLLPGVACCGSLCPLPEARG
ncbi:siderophore-iron reductase FhuF [Bosea sp. (in: a-proteobacteria)]|uniref:siderophore-iron reductase FhuF n=1 Tax=Bosea sp. (in: a-proteobacteria) TaxID=1871050 RepID=UPI002FCA283B